MNQSINKSIKTINPKKMINYFSRLNSETVKHFLYYTKHYISVSLADWKRIDCSAVWLNFPIQQSRLIPVAANLGFMFHHAEGVTSTMCQWLRQRSVSKLPVFGTHQIGVAGMTLQR